MANFLHRTKKIYLHSISPNELPEDISNYIEYPNLSTVEGIPTRYWLITGDVVSEMSAGEKAVVDQAILDTNRDGNIQGAVDDVESNLRQIVIMIIGELNILRQAHGLPDRTLSQVRTQLRNGYGS